MRNLVFMATVALTAALPAFAEESCQLKRYGVIPFETDESSQIFIRATLDGNPARLMLDTGAYWSLLSKARVGPHRTKSAGKSGS